MTDVEAVEAEPVDVDDAEAALVEHYPRLVRIAYVTLPAAMGRHRRVLLSHRLVQRALPRTRRPATGVGEDADPAYALVRGEVVRGALAYGRRQAGWRRWARAALVAAPLPPQVLGLRLFPRTGDMDELALDRALSELDAPARAAYAVRGVEGLDEEQTTALLAAVGVAAPRKAMHDASAAAKTVDFRSLATAEFDPCVVHARPTDLMRRRQHVRAGAAIAAAATVAVALLGVPGDGGGGGFGAAGPLGPQQAALNRVLDPSGVVRADSGTWTRTARLDFSSWPARGDRTDDHGLLQRALDVWARPSDAVRVSATPGTAQTPPVTSPQLLFAGDVEGAGVVLLYDGLRVVRYAEPVDGGAAPVLDFARVDGASTASASAVVVTRSDGNARYLTAPWIEHAELRNLLKPGGAPQPLKRSADGVTDPVPVPAADGSCGAADSSWTAMRLTPRAGTPDQQPFLLTDLAELTPAHLTHASGPGAKQGEVNDPQALGDWAHAACRLAAARGNGVRTVGNWQFADQQLPDDAGTANWLCTRADTWSGADHVSVQFVPPATAANTPATVVARGQSTAACGPMSPGVLSGVLWKSPTGHWYLVAAGSPEVTSISAGGAVRSTADGHTLAVPAKPTSHPELSGRLPDGSTLAALT
ncbi:hypothetical protein [Streptantibioticus ferralitis]|uniref:DNA-directed RNA polymerase specialized sigma24 family protein n=1 Tax=Streptantibioticus ferralitis TaxID=236510 RepID=A0ABT5Z850_9ACTN|nr:hypothetical protein [Streptantibioticus ferralitis]MDF2260007.1 hypothetical protein [Streptantibioticus ferralitis]